MDSDLLSLRDVSFSYPGGRRLAGRFPGLRREAVSGMTFSVKSGESIALLGGNGSGKSTLLRLLDGLLEPESGEICWKGRPMDRSRRGLSRMRAETGFLFQDPDDQLFAQSLVQDAAFGPLNQGVPDGEARNRAMEALSRVGLSACADLPPHVLSHGMRKRAALAGTLALRPRLLLLDEPTAGLDPESEDRFLSLLERFLSEGGTVLLSTHDLDLARDACGRSLVLSEGRIAADGPTEAVLSDRELLVSCGLARRRRLSERAVGMNESIGDGIRPIAQAAPSRLLVLTGDGKGKTSSAAGMLLRALGHGQSAALVRFLKNRGSGEVDPLERLGVRIAGGGRGFLPRSGGSAAWESHAQAAREAWEETRAILAEVEAPALVVLDEICIALDRELLRREEVEPVLRTRRTGVSVVCTGRAAPGWLRGIADTVSEVECRKHAFQAGIPATEGIEL